MDVTKMPLSNSKTVSACQKRQTVISKLRQSLRLHLDFGATITILKGSDTNSRGDQKKWVTMSERVERHGVSNFEVIKAPTHSWNLVELIRVKM